MDELPPYSLAPKKECHPKCTWDCGALEGSELVLFFLLEVTSYLIQHLSQACRATLQFNRGARK
eukprot:5263522-Amphidinium_carterae.2